MSKQSFYFENREGIHSKFWAILITDSSYGWTLTRRWGRIGEEGRVMQERIVNLRTAERRKDKLIKEKLAKGYKPVL